MFIAIAQPTDLSAIASLFRAYAASLPISLDYQDFDAELAALPGKYARPKGALMLARNAAGAAIGCVALRAFDIVADPTPDGVVGEAAVCEMKRLYVAPEGRGLGLGRQLAAAIIEAGRAANYREMRLDTLPTMTSAIALYEALGFTRIAAYYDTPIAETVFMSLKL